MLTKKYPRYTHDCDNCQYIGQFANFDIYLCDNTLDGLINILCRYSSKGSAYASSAFSKEEWEETKHKVPNLLSDNLIEQLAYKNLMVACFLMHNSMASQLTYLPKYKQ